ncbi:MAG: hypothetical protein HOP03_17740 [Lysobacter sp.]|nr:hypothetical protein [Lysobacter sp.]
MSHDHLPCAGPRSALNAFCVLVLSCGLSACDPPSTAELAHKADASPVSAEADVSPSASTRAFVQSAAPASASGKEQAPPEVDENPPLASEVELTPREKEGNPEGNAELAVRYENAEMLGEEVKFVIDKRVYHLKRDPRDSKRFAALIDFDFDLFAVEQENRKQEIVEAKATKFPVFEGRELVAESEFEFIDPEFLRTARDRSLPIAIRQSMISLPISFQQNPAKTLMITDLSVVQDPTRTFDICGNVGDPDGAWTFKTLMKEMANQSSTSVHPADFVEAWLQTWNTTHTGTPFPIPARTKMNNLVLNPWPRDANGRLDLDQSPMRLLAIVNRLDLRSSSTGSSSYGGSGGIPVNAGEGRFVFGVVNRNNNGGCSKMDFTIILEYEIPINQCTAIRSYAQEWLALGNITLGSAAFNPALQAITDQFTLAGAGGTKPNGSAIKQIRTNEIALGNGYGGPIGSASALSGRAPIPSGDPWELREFHLQGDNMLHVVSTKNTPHHTRNNTALLASYINSNLSAILSGTHIVPNSWASQPFLTGSTLNMAVVDSAVWKAPGVVSPQARHKFSLNTCDSCHAGETRYNGKPAVSFPSGSTPETNFVHITPRNINVQSHLSKFLTGVGTLVAPSTFPKGDPTMPAPSYTTRSFGDVLRRQSDLAAMSNHSCSASALLQEAMFRRLNNAH